VAAKPKVHFRRKHPTVDAEMPAASAVWKRVLAMVAPQPFQAGPSIGRTSSRALPAQLAPCFCARVGAAESATIRKAKYPNLVETAVIGAPRLLVPGHGTLVSIGFLGSFTRRLFGRSARRIFGNGFYNFAGTGLLGEIDSYHFLPMRGSVPFMSRLRLERCLTIT
jgi:hypothetical protein